MTAPGRSRVNRYPGRCAVCSCTVPALGGVLVGKRPAHLACASNGRPEVLEIRWPGGSASIRNVRGRCEDAPCCGCCTI